MIPDLIVSFFYLRTGGDSPQHCLFYLKMISIRCIPVSYTHLAHVTEDGVHFHDPFTEQEDFIGPEESMQIQCRIGADIHMAYDELTSLADSYEYNVEALARTER